MEFETLHVAKIYDWNTGYRNTGNWNTGNWNTGDWNTGSWNTGSWNTGYFNNTTPSKIEVFGVLTDREVWDNAKKPDFIYFDLTVWISYSDMKPEEKIAHPEAEHITGGYLKKKDYKEAWAEAYAKATPEEIKLLKELPNFNAEIFKDITGIEVK